ncbi:glycoside hydrolase [Trichoderma arundinaceum]|uniref:Glycoside hydrolase n=1 Tax=Trichoderma arundinaceum TaxID=490622 RepID=A0A395NLX7_TRIAR|nr:glycoside hydrolase [Trichoderma arundinaceum]
MYKAVALTSIAALAGQTMAFNAHRHQHQVDKRAMETDWTTVYETVYVTVDPPASTPAAAKPTGFGAEDVPSPVGNAAAGTHVGAGSSAPTVVVASSVPAASSPAAPATQATTLATAVRQSSAAPIETSIAPALPSSAPESSSQQAPPTTAAPQPTSEEATPTPTPTPVESSSSQAPPPPSSTSAPAPSATPSKPASPPPSSGGAFPGKRGMAYNDGTLANLFGAASDKIGWAYNWGFWPSGIDTSKYSYVPTLWSPAPDHSNGFDEQAEAALASGSKAIFSFNECDIASQANMSPADAASAHAQWLNKYSGRALIGAPSVSNSGAQGQGLSWLQSFVDACSSLPGGCAYDFCNVHWYSPASAVDTLFSHLEGASKICGGKPVVLTEFAPAGSDDEINSFLQDVLPKLDALDYVIGYSYFMVGTGSLLSSATSLSSYGNTYATA